MTLPQAVSEMAAMIHERSAIVEYLRAKLEAEDWHAVRDARVDLEVLDARIEMLEGE